MSLPGSAGPGEAGAASGSGASVAAPTLTLVGDRVALGPVHKGLQSLLWKWENDLELGVLTGDPVRPVAPEGIEKLYEQLSASGPEHTSFAIYERLSSDRSAWRPIGTIGLISINHAHRTAELGVGIGERDCWGKGLGSEATRLVVDYGFNVLGLHNIMLRVFSYNERAIKAYQKVGFQEIGRRRQAQRIGANVYDVVLMDCLASEFAGSAFGALLPPPPGQADSSDA